jgi:hypothetical protein
MALCALDGNRRCRRPLHASAKGLVAAGVGQCCWVDPHGPGFRNVYAVCRQTSSAEIATAPYGVKPPGFGNQAGRTEWTDRGWLSPRHNA